MTCYLCVEGDLHVHCDACGSVSHDMNAVLAAMNPLTERPPGQAELSQLWRSARAPGEAGRRARVHTLLAAELVRLASNRRRHQTDALQWVPDLEGLAAPKDPAFAGSLVLHVPTAQLLSIAPDGRLRGARPLAMSGLKVLASWLAEQMPSAPGDPGHLPVHTPAGMALPDDPVRRGRAFPPPDLEAQRQLAAWMAIGCDAVGAVAAAVGATVTGWVPAQLALVATIAGSGRSHPGVELGMSAGDTWTDEPFFFAQPCLGELVNDVRVEVRRLPVVSATQLAQIDPEDRRRYCVDALRRSVEQSLAYAGG